MNRNHHISQRPRNAGYAGHVVVSTTICVRLDVGPAISFFFCLRETASRLLHSALHPSDVTPATRTYDIRTYLHQTIAAHAY